MSNDRGAPSLGVCVPCDYETPGERRFEGGGGGEFSEFSEYNIQYTMQNTAE
jgi:hypothetical protein